MNSIRRAEEYLRHYNDMYRAQQFLQRQLDALVHRSGPSFYPKIELAGMPKGPGKAGITIQELAEADKIGQALENVMQHVQIVDKLLFEISQDSGCEMYGQLLRWWYIECLDRYEIAGRTQYSVRTIYRLRKQAICKCAFVLFGPG